MKVILRKHYDQLGEMGAVVEVKDGFARNYLIPRGLAYLAKPSSIKALEEEKKQMAHKLAKELEDAKKLAAELETVKVKITVKVGEDDRIFGSVTTQMIADGLKEKGYDIDKRKIEIPEPIKTIGISYTVNVKLHLAVTASVNIWVVKE